MGGEGKGKVELNYCGRVQKEGTAEGGWGVHRGQIKLSTTNRKKK